jgi:hypothetical protein
VLRDLISVKEGFRLSTRLRQAVLLTCLFVAQVAISACSGSHGAASPTPPASPSAAPAAAPAVPDRYKSTYAELEDYLSKFEQTLATGQPKLSDIGVISSSLIMANSNSGQAVLRPQVLESAKTYMDDMAKLGSKGVEIQISYPVASKDFPNQDAFIAFYKQVMEAARQRGFTVLIETSVVFANSPFTEVQFDSSRFTPQSYFQARTEEIVTIAKELRPDYLAVGEEPVNERVFGGINYTPAQYIGFVNSAFAAVRSALGADAAKVKVGVGTGTWEADLFADLVRQTDADFYDIHIYPLGGSQPGLQTARQMAKLAQDKGKPAIIGETWLYKLSQAEQGAVAGATAAEAFRRDAFTFWEPLEARYIRDVLALAAESKLPFVSFWGARFFFGQVDWTPQLDALDFKALSGTVNPIINQGINSNMRSRLGEDFARLMGR